MSRIFSGLAAFLVLASPLCAADWLQFRGNDSSGVSSAQNVPVEWSDTKNIAWKVDLEGRGLSGPIVIGDRVVVTSSSGFNQDRLHVDCFDAASGEQLWKRQFWATGRTQTHRKMCVATPTPASDGKRIFAFYSSNDLICLDLDGNLLWFRGLTHDFPNASNSLGMASSPIVAGETLVVQVESDAESFATGVNVETGESRWKIDRPRKANWTSPVLLRGASRADDLVLLQSADGVDAVKPKSGEVAWSFGDGASTIPSSTIAGNIIYVPSNGITALRPIPGSDAPEVVWQVNRLAPSTPSPFIYDGRVYAVNRGGALACADTKTGDVVWQLRLKGAFSGSPVAAGGHIYFFNEEGLVLVVKPGEKEGEIVSENNLGEVILCTPAIADGAIYVRSDAHLWKIAETGKK